MRNDEFSHYYGRHKARSNYVIQKNVIHKGKTYQFRADYGLHREIQSLSKELNQSESKVIKDILEDFFLDRKNISWQYEINSWK
jgi:hypothetical protein